MSQPRLLRTIAYQRFGVFRARELLVQRGVEIPSEQIAAVARFLQAGLGDETDLSFVFGPSDAVEGKMRTIFGRTLDAPGSPLEAFIRPLSHLALEVQPLIAWDPFQDFAELLTAACSPVYSKVALRLRAHFQLGVSDAADFSDQFVLSALPNAVRKFDLCTGRGAEAKWLETVFYRYCLKRTLADLQSRRQFKEMRSELSEGTTEPSVSEPEIPEIKELYDALDELPDVEQRALELYFGLQRREHAIYEVALALSCTEHHARAAVLRGIARLSAKFHAHGALNEDEFQLVQRYFGEGKQLATAAADARLEIREARQVLLHAQKKIAGVLRVRTNTRRLNVESTSVRKREKHMPAVIEDQVLPTADILREVRKLKVTPTIRTDVEGHCKVLLAEHWVHIARVLQVLQEQPTVLHDLEARNVPLDWLAVPDPTPVRADVSDDQAHLQDVFDALARRAYEQARLVTSLWLDAIAEKKLPSPNGDFDEIVGSVLSPWGASRRQLKRNCLAP